MTAIKDLQAAFQKAETIRPKVGGFPVLAACLKAAGAKRNIWQLPSGQSIFAMADGGAVAMPALPQISELTEVPSFDEARFTESLRRDQAGETTFPEFLENCWQAGIVSYSVDFEARTCSYYGIHGESYVEEYPEIDV
ncbi:MAG: DUF1398 family protein [Streptococcaceae bacterium]|jgi:uncharacterized protein YbcV (DUF1398 family)|nr:DUF1398 family protein [Streptococcaceae bacterium]